MIYNQLFEDQLSLGIIERIEPETNKHSHPIHYLPHHCIKTENKSTPLRIVFDASAKIKGYHSLNECLYRGPLMLEDLVELLLRFRMYKYGITADIEKAFLQIGLQNDDRDVTRFLWVKNVDQEVESGNLVYYRFC